MVCESGHFRTLSPWILWAASRAEKASDHILGVVSEEPIPADSTEEVIPEPALAE